MSLKSKKIFSVGIAIGALLPLSVALSATVTPSNSQYSAPTPTVTSTTPDQATADQANNTATGKSKGQPKVGFKDPVAVKEFSWDGPYLGVFAGADWGNSRLNTTAGKITPVSYYSSIANTGSVSAHGTGTLQPRGGIGGIQIGNNVQSGRMVYGAVLDYGSFRLNGAKNAINVTYPTAPFQYTSKAAMSTSWLASLRARLGFVPARSWPLLYATGGIAITSIHVFNAFNDNTAALAVGGATNSKVKAGWVVGAGVEYPILVNWTIDGEYQFVNFGSNKANSFIQGNGFASTYSTAANLSASMLRFGVNYKFS